MSIRQWSDEVPKVYLFLGSYYYRWSLSMVSKPAYVQECVHVCEWGEGME
jgi:hypothetical protein